MRTSTATTPADPTTHQAGSGERRFLPEVQALRALAVAMVVVYHLRPSLLPGGYIGVDVFFVISGYLITGHMLREVVRARRIDLVRFWANRARRILPASLLVILTVVVTAVLVYPASEWGPLYRQAIASIFYVQNWVLAADSVDYMAAGNVATPFQHFWSLAVEEQFYLGWPLIVALAALVVRHGAPRHASAQALGRVTATYAAAGFGLVVLASFTLSLVRVSAGDPSAYFVTTTRLWELGVGGLLAVCLRYTDRYRVQRTALALAGLVTVVGAAFWLNASSPFPGAAALYPVLGTAAVIAAGRTRGPLSLTPVVDLRAVQWLGNVSYSLYLWHFPLIVGFSAWAARSPRIRECVVLLALACVLAQLSYRFVEGPARRHPFLVRSDRRTLGLALAAMIVVALCASVLPVRSAQIDARWERLAAGLDVVPGSGLGAEAVRDGTLPAFVRDPVVVPNPAAAAKDTGRAAGQKDRCFTADSTPATPRCDIARTTGPPWPSSATPTCARCAPR